jgi:hypothetical protein
LTDPTIYTLTFNTKQGLKTTKLTRRQIYDRKGFRGLKFFRGKNCKSFKDGNEVFGYPYLEWTFISNMTSIEEKIQNEPNHLSIQTQHQINQQKQLSGYPQFPRVSLIRIQLNESIPLLYKPPIDKCDWPGCNYRPSRPRDLNKHKESVHLKNYKFECSWPECNKRFASKQSLKDHINLHTGKRPYKCLKKIVRSHQFTYR